MGTQTFAALLVSFTDAVVVETTLGPVLGSLEKPEGSSQGIHVFRAVPFAATTAGGNRFLPPKPKEPWTEPLNCTQNGTKRSITRYILILSFIPQDRAVCSLTTTKMSRVMESQGLVVRWGSLFLLNLTMRVWACRAKIA